MSQQVNPEMLILGRDLRGLTQSRLSVITQIDQGLISRYETRVREIPQHDLEKIAETLDLPVEFFYRSGHRFGAGRAFVHHRKRKSLPLRLQRLLESRMDDIRLTMERLLDSAEIETPYEFPQLSVTEQLPPSAIAKLVRVAWRLPSGPLTNLVLAIENAGGVVIPLNFGTSKIDALVQHVPPMPPVILVNDAIPGDRLRFTLAHEIGHIVMHPTPVENEDEEADEFASALLMPAEDIRRDLFPATIERFAQLKPYWRVSIQALIRRARTLNVITERKYRSLFSEMSKLGIRKVEPSPIPREQPTLLKEILELHRNEYGYTLEELSKTAAMHLEEFRVIFLHEPQGIRIVKKSPTPAKKRYVSQSG